MVLKIKALAQPRAATSERRSERSSFGGQIMCDVGRVVERSDGGFGLRSSGGGRPRRGGREGREFDRPAQLADPARTLSLVRPERSAFREIQEHSTEAAQPARSANRRQVFAATRVTGWNSAGRRILRLRLRVLSPEPDSPELWLTLATNHDRGTSLLACCCTFWSGQLRSKLQQGRSSARPAAEPAQITSCGTLLFARADSAIS